jgi:hypothetical protein
MKLFPATRITAALSCLVLLAGCAGSKPHQPPSAAHRQFHEQTFQVDGGAFRITQFALYPSSILGVEARGTVKNETNKKWIAARFSIELRDQSGSKIGQEVVVIQNIGPNESKLIGGSQNGQSIRTTPYNAKPDSINIEFVGGEFPAEYTFKLEKPATAQGLSLADKRFDLRFSVTRTRIGLNLQNKTDEPIFIDWDSVAFVDFEGQTGKVITAGTKFIDKDKPQVKAVVPPNAKFSTEILPSSLVSYISTANIGWTETPMLPNGPKAILYQGKTFSLFLPLQIGNKVENINLVLELIK